MIHCVPTGLPDMILQQLCVKMLISETTKMQFELQSLPAADIIILKPLFCFLTSHRNLISVSAVSLSVPLDQQCQINVS